MSAIERCPEGLCVMLDSRCIACGTVDLMDALKSALAKRTDSAQHERFVQRVHDDVVAKPAAMSHCCGVALVESECSQCGMVDRIAADMAVDDCVNAKPSGPYRVGSGNRSTDYIVTGPGLDPHLLLHSTLGTDCESEAKTLASCLNVAYAHGQAGSEVRDAARRLAPFLARYCDLGWPGLSERDRGEANNARVDLLNAAGL